MARREPPKSGTACDPALAPAPPVAVGLAREGDLGAIRALAEGYRAEAARQGWDEPARWRGLAEVRAETLDRRFMLVVREAREARESREALGFLVARPAAEGGVIHLLAVDGAHRRRGFGSALLAAALARLPPGPVYLEVARGNAPARALYERLGFILHRETEVSCVLVRLP